MLLSFAAGILDGQGNYPGLIVCVCLLLLDLAILLARTIELHSQSSKPDEWIMMPIKIDLSAGQEPTLENVDRALRAELLRLVKYIIPFVYNINAGRLNGIANSLTI